MDNSRRCKEGWRDRLADDDEGVATAWEDATTLITPGSMKKKKNELKKRTRRGRARVGCS